MSEENIIRKGETILDKNNHVMISNVGVDHIVPDINKDIKKVVGDNENR